MSNITTVIVQLHNQHLACWTLTKNHPPQPQRVQGDWRIRIHGADLAARCEALREACQDIAQRLRDVSDVAAQRIGWLVDAPSRALLLQLLRTSGPGLPGHAEQEWQILDWDWVCAHLGLHGEEALEPHQPYDSQRNAQETPLSRKVLPWLHYLYHSSQTPGQLQNAQASAAAREQDERIAQLEAQLVQLGADNARLQSQLQHIHSVDTERLLTYLPAIFQKPFGVLGATDLALLTGHVTPLPIPNPYPEPSGETLAVLQERFRKLPHAQQQEIVALVRELPQRQKLQPHPHMRLLVAELEGSKK